MAITGNLGEYRVVVTADYTQLQKQMQSLKNMMSNVTTSITSSLNVAGKAMADGITKQMESVNSAVKSTVGTVSDTMSNVSKTTANSGKAADDAAKGFKSYSQQIREAEIEAQKFHQQIEELQKRMGTASWSQADISSLSVLQTRFRDILQQIDQLKAAQADYNMRLNQTANLERTAAAAKKQADRDGLQALRERQRAEQEIINRRVRESQQAHQQQQAQLRQLASQYRNVYEQANRYLQTHTRMTEMTFVRLQAQMASIQAQMHGLGASPLNRNPLEGMNYEQYTQGLNQYIGLTDAAAARTNIFADAVRSLKHHMMWMASAVFMGGIIGLPFVISEATKEFEALNTKIMQNLELTSKYRGDHAALSSDVEKLGKVAQEYAKGFGMSVGEVQEAMQIITRRFKDVNTATYLTGVALKMSKLDFVDTAKSARDLESVLLQFGMGAKEAGNFLNDFSVILHTARINGTEMLDALERSGSAFRALNMNAREAMAAIATLSTATGLSGSTIGMTFKSIATNLDTRKGREALEALNIKLYELDDTGRKVVRNGAQIFMELQDAFKNLNEEGQRQLAYLIAGGKYQANAALALLRDTGGNFRKFLDDMKSMSSDAMTESLMEKSLNTYAVGIGRMKASFEVLAQTIGGTFLPAMEAVVYVGIAVVDAMTQNADAISGIITALGKLAFAYIAVRGAMIAWAIASTVVAGIKAVYLGISSALMGVTLAQGAATLATMAYTAANSLATGVSVAMGIASGILSGALTLEGIAAVAAAGAMALLDATLLPIIATVMAVVAVLALLTVALYDVVTNWETYSGEIQAIWNTLVEVVSYAVELIILAMTPLIIQTTVLYNVAKYAWREVIIPVVRWAAGVLGDVLSWMTEKLGLHGKSVSSILSSIADVWRSCVQWLHDNVSPSFARFLDSIIGSLVRAAQKIAQIASQIQKAIANAFTIGGDTSVNVDTGGLGGGDYSGGSLASFRKAEEHKAEDKGFWSTLLEDGLSGIVERGKSAMNEATKNIMGDAFKEMANDTGNPYAAPPEMLRGLDDLGTGGGGGSGGKGGKGGSGGKGAKAGKEEDPQKQLQDAYRNAKERYEKVLLLLEEKLAPEGKSPTAENKRNLFVEAMGGTEGMKQFDGLKEFFMDFHRLNIAKAKEDYEAAKKARQEAEKRDAAIRKATDSQVAAQQKMADEEVAFAEKLGIMTKADVRQYKFGQNERNYESKRNVLDSMLGKTVDSTKGTADEIVAIYYAMIDAENEAEANHYAQRLYYLSGDVNATQKALEERMKLEEKYQMTKYKLEQEAFLESNRLATGFIDSVSDSYQQTLEGILTRTKSFGEALRDMFTSIANSIIKMFTEMWAEKLKTKLAQWFFPQQATGHASGTRHDKGQGGYDLVGWAQGSLPMLGMFGGGGKKSKGGAGNIFGFTNILNPIGGRNSGGMINALVPQNLNQMVRQRMAPAINNMQTMWKQNYNLLDNISTNGINQMAQSTMTGCQSMSGTFSTMKDAQVTAEVTGNEAITASSEATQTSVQSSMMATMGWIMAALALLSLFMSFGSKKTKTETSTSSTNLGRAPDTYYMTPTPVLQSTNYSVPSMDIGGNIEQDMLIFAHKNEMVLTPEQADVIRSTARSGGGSLGGGGTNANVKSTINISTVDSKGFDRVLKDYNRSLSKQVKKGIRNGYLTAKGLL